MSWAEVVAEARRRGAWLEEVRVPGPPHLGLLLPNGIDYLLWIFAAAEVGWAVVGLNPTRRGDALVADVRATDCQLVIVDAHSAELLAASSDGLGATRVVDGAEARNHAATGPDSPPATTVADGDLLLLLFTSGTTGTPKAVRCTQGRLASIAETVVGVYGFKETDVCYCPMPLFHGNALMALVAPALAIGATIALPPRFSARNFLDDVRAFDATMFTYVGKAIAYLLATEPSADDAHNSLERAFGTEASAPDRLRFEQRFGCTLIEGYGSSEGGVNITATPDTPPGSLGPAPPGMDLAVVDPESGEEMARARFDEHGRLVNGTESIGEIVNRSGPGKFEGYYANGVAEQERTRGGWYWTGDLAYRDEEGYFWFAGRGGDWLRVDSENLAATPIEAVLSRYGGFAHVAVYAVPDVEGGTGDAVMAAVELTNGEDFDVDAFDRWLDEQRDLGTKWAPAFLRVTTALDETATGKITKVRLKAEAWHCTDPVWYRPSRTMPYGRVDQAVRSLLDQRLAERTAHTGP